MSKIGESRNLKELIENIEEKLKNISSQWSCINSKVPEGRVWCDYFDQSFAGRCDFSCLGYKNKYLLNQQ